MKIDKYIGVTGFTNREEVEYAIENCGIKIHFPNLKLMVGVLASRKTMAGLNPSEKFIGRYPATKDIESIFSSDASCLNLVHYHTKNSQELAEELQKVLNIAGPNCHGLQLNICWPDIYQLIKFRKLVGDVPRLVLQISGGAYQAVNSDPEELADRIEAYRGLTNYLLLDPSGGQGKPLVVKETRKILEVLIGRGVHQYMSIGIAGGLCAEMVPHIRPLYQEFPELSNMDAEGNILNRNTNKIERSSMVNYTRNALTLY